MNKSLLAALMCIIARFEKGRIPAGVVRKSTYRSILSQSLDMLDFILKIIENDMAVSPEEIDSIIQYVVSRGMILLSQSEQYDLRRRILRKSADTAEEADDSAELISLMHQILSRCRYLLTKRKIGYRRDLFYLLQAFHNLPRGYIVNDGDDFFGIRGVSVKEAIQQLLEDPNVIKAMGKGSTISGY